MMKEKKKYEEYQRDPDFYVDLTKVKINVFVFVLIFTVKKYLNFLNSHILCTCSIYHIINNTISQFCQSMREPLSFLLNYSMDPQCFI